MIMFTTIGLITKCQDKRVGDTLYTLIHYLHQHKRSMLIETESAAAWPAHGLRVADCAELGAECNLIIVIGGDGTILKAARLLAQHDVRLLGINLGRLGFLADILPYEIIEYLDIILGGRFLEEKRFLLHAEVIRGTECLCESEALNDVVIHKWNMAHMLAYATNINNQFVSNQRADGVIISSPTGSTAYALSEGGPLMHPSLNALLLVSICPHTLSNRPIVIDGDSVVEISLLSEQKIEGAMTCDGILCQALLPGDRIVIRKSHGIRLIHPHGHNHYDTLRAKLHWGKAL
ncbi:MAG: NAD(+) kinase [Gammaproteobacteria bacterium]|nr:NAD(+) kinase [Gammaproteobacteria bacterium]